MAHVVTNMGYSEGVAGGPGLLRPFDVSNPQMRLSPVRDRIT